MATPESPLEPADEPGAGSNEPEEPRNNATTGAETPTGASHVRAFLKPSRRQLVVAAVLALTAMLVVLTVRTQATQPDYANLRREELVELLDGMSVETRRLEAEVRNLQSTRDELASGAEGAKAADREIERRLEVMRILSGTVPVKGKGIRITIADPNKQVTPELLLNSIEELRDAGAEVLEFNDEVRVIASTWIAFDDKGRLLADGVELTAPIVIDAIGEPATLEAGARFRGGLVSQVEAEPVAGTVRIEQLEEISIDSVVRIKKNEYAKPN